jgi:hypothetical protein
LAELGDRLKQKADQHQMADGMRRTVRPIDQVAHPAERAEPGGQKALAMSKSYKVAVVLTDCHRQRLMVDAPVPV